MAEERGNYNGTERAAVLLMSLGEELAANVMKLMGPKEVQRIGQAMATLENVSKNQMGGVLTEFISEVDNQTALGIGNDDYVRNVLVQALGEDKAGGIIDRVLMGHSSKGLEALKWMDARAVAEVIRLEHPQIVAIVLAYLDSDHAAEVLSMLPTRTRSDIIMRIATLDGIQPQALMELDEIMERQFAGTGTMKSSNVGGVKSAADILNFVESVIESEVIDEIRDSNNELGDMIQDLMFVFDNLADVDGTGIQALLREVSSDILILALKGADDTVKEKIFSNMSKRAGEMLRDDLEAKGPVRQTDEEGAQKEILAVARRLADSGDIVLGGKGAEQMV